MDLKLPDMDGVTATRQIRARFPQTQVIAVSQSADKDLVQRALEAGAVTFLPKRVASRELIECIRFAKTRAKTTPLRTAA